MIKTIRGWFANDISIDLGTANTLVYVCGHGVVFNEPSIVAVRYSGHDAKPEVVAVGNEAKQMVGRTPENMQTIRPLKDGVITDFAMTEKMLKLFLHKIMQSAWIKPRPRIVICVPCGASEVDRRMIKEAALSMNAKSVYLIEEPMAAAIGAGLPIHLPSAAMVVDIGGGTTEIAVLSLGGVVMSASLKVGGDKFDELIIDYVARHYDCLIGENTAEEVKINIGSAFPGEDILEIAVSGRHLKHGIPVKFTLNSNEIMEALQPALDDMIQGIHHVLQKTSPELAADVATHGLTLTGGGALLRNLAEYIKESLGLDAKVADDPLHCVAKGGGLVLERSKKKTQQKTKQAELVEA